jgi:A/G-specific adenine glycosylase
LDGNVKRVLTRFLGFKDDLALSRHERALWDIAQTLLPQRDVARAMPRYTQGVMDLGATVCTPKQPQCTQCPLKGPCVAASQGTPERYPVKTRKLKRSAEQLWLLQAQTSKGQVWLMQRPQSGVWAGLYCLPVFDGLADLQHAVPAKYRDRLVEAEVFKHVLTHKDLYLHPVQIELPASAALSDGQWVDSEAWQALGLPAPIRKLLNAHARNAR